VTIFKRLPKLCEKYMKVYNSVEQTRECMKNKIALAFVTIALAAMVTGMTIGTMQIAQASQGPPEGSPYGDLVKGEAQAGERGFGGDLQDFCDQGECGPTDQKLGDFRASDEADKNPGKTGDNIDENAGNPDN
jgi:hypothetical protein